MNETPMEKIQLKFISISETLALQARQIASLSKRLKKLETPAIVHPETAGTPFDRHICHTWQSIDKSTLYNNMRCDHCGEVVEILLIELDIWNEHQLTTTCPAREGRLADKEPNY